MNVTLSGPFRQIVLTNPAAIAAVGSPDVDLDSELAGAALDPAYDPNVDSRFDDDVLVQANPPFFGASGGSPGSTSFSFSAGSGPGSMATGASPVPLAYVVLPANAVGGYFAVVARGTTEYTLAGPIMGPAGVPTVSPGGLLALAALLLAAGALRAGGPRVPL